VWSLIIGCLIVGAVPALGYLVPLAITTVTLSVVAYFLSVFA
jgi:hypothetical protein